MCMSNDALRKGQEWKTLQNKSKCSEWDESESIWIFTSVPFSWRLKQSMCVTYKLTCDRTWSCQFMYIYTFTFTWVPDLGARSQPFVHGTEKPYRYIGSDDGDLLVWVYYSALNLQKNKTKIKKHFWNVVLHLMFEMFPPCGILSDSFALIKKS